MAASKVFFDSARWEAIASSNSFTRDSAYALSPELDGQMSFTIDKAKTEQKELRIQKSNTLTAELLHGSAQIVPVLFNLDKSFACFHQVEVEGLHAHGTSISYTQIVPG